MFSPVVLDLLVLERLNCAGFCKTDHFKFEHAAFGLDLLLALGAEARWDLGRENARKDITWCSVPDGGFKPCQKIETDRRPLSHLRMRSKCTARRDALGGPNLGLGRHRVIRRIGWRVRGRSARLGVRTGSKVARIRIVRVRPLVSAQLLRQAPREE